MKSKVFSKVVVLCMAMVMLFSVAFFGAGTCVLYTPVDPSPPCPILSAHKAGAIVELQEHVYALGERNFTRTNWDVMLEYLDAGRVDIIMAVDAYEVDSVLEAAKDRMGGIDMWDRMGRTFWNYSECLNFAISTEVFDMSGVRQLWFNIGDTVVFDIVFKNISGVDYVIVDRWWRTTNLFSVSIRPWTIPSPPGGYDEPPPDDWEPYLYLFSSNSYIREVVEFELWDAPHWWRYRDFLHFHSVRIGISATMTLYPFNSTDCLELISYSFSGSLISVVGPHN